MYLLLFKELVVEESNGKLTLMGIEKKPLPTYPKNNGEKKNYYFNM
jgi:hypothetical protein